MPATMLESMTKGRSIAMKNKEGVWEKITKEKYESLTDAEKAGVMLTDDSLKFYTKEEPYCEVLLPHWFKDKFKNKFKTDKELLKIEIDTIKELYHHIRQSQEFEKAKQLLNKRLGSDKRP